MVALKVVVGGGGGVGGRGWGQLGWGREGRGGWGREGRGGGWGRGWKKEKKKAMSECVGLRAFTSNRADKLGINSNSNGDSNDVERRSLRFLTISSLGCGLSPTGVLE